MVSDITANLWWIAMIAFALLAGIVCASDDRPCSAHVIYAQRLAGSIPVTESCIGAPHGLALTRYAADVPLQSCGGRSVLHSNCVSEDQLEDALRGDLKPYAADFISAGKAHNVCPLFLASVCALESGWGSSSIANKNNNLAGLAVAGTYLSFDDPADSIEYLARLIEAGYDDGDAYYGGSTTVAGIAVHYNPDHARDWAKAVQEIMDDMTERIVENE